MSRCQRLLYDFHPLLGTLKDFGGSETPLLLLFFLGRELENGPHPMVKWKKAMWSTCRRSSSELAGYYIPRRTLRHFFLPSAPRQPHRHFHPEVCKTRQIYIDVGIFISRCFLCSDIILCLGIFTQKLGGKTRNLGGKKWNLAEFCSKHFSALNNMTRPYKIYQPRHFFWGSGNRQK